MNSTKKVPIGMFYIMRREKEILVFCDRSHFLHSLNFKILLQIFTTAVELLNVDEKMTFLVYGLLIRNKSLSKQRNIIAKKRT